LFIKNGPLGKRKKKMKKIITAKKKNSKKELIEELSDLEHEQWISMTKYLLNNNTKDNHKRWEKQIKTDYKDLTEKEKDSDREWAEKVIKILKKYKKL